MFTHLYPGSNISLGLVSQSFCINLRLDNAEFSTPYKLRQDMINKIPTEFWSNPNHKVFELIDKSKFDDGLAKVTNDANFERHIAKVALQKRFFDSDLTEFKNRN